MLNASSFHPIRTPATPPPSDRAVRLAGTELSSTHHLIRFFRDSYAASQGRQWLQPHILWWSLTFLRDNGVRLDLDAVSATPLRMKAARMPLPAGHGKVHPAGQIEANFTFWWSILIDIARRVYRPWWRRAGLNVAHPLPDFAELRRRASELHLHPWMSSATVEELAGIAHALNVIAARTRLSNPTPDAIMTDILLPELLIADLHWLHTPGGRPRPAGTPPIDIVVLRRYEEAESRWNSDRYLSALGHMYLRAGDILEYFSRLPADDVSTAMRPVLAMHRRLLHAHTLGTESTPLPSRP